MKPRDQQTCQSLSESDIDGSNELIDQFKSICWPSTQVRFVAFDRVHGLVILALLAVIVQAEHQEPIVGVGIACVGSLCDQRASDDNMTITVQTLCYSRLFF